MNAGRLPGTLEADLAAELEVRDYYNREERLLPLDSALADPLVDCAQLLPGEVLLRPSPARSSLKRCAPSAGSSDNAMEAIERENPKPARACSAKLRHPRRSESVQAGRFVALFSDTNFHAAEYKGRAAGSQGQRHPGHISSSLSASSPTGHRKAASTTRPRAIVAALIVNIGPSRGSVRPGHGLRRHFRAERRVHRTALAAKPAKRVRQQSQRPDQRVRAGATAHHWKLAAMNRPSAASTSTSAAATPTPAQRSAPRIAGRPRHRRHAFNMKEWWNAVGEMTRC